MAVILLFVMVVSCIEISSAVGEMALANVTRLATGDLFSLFGTDCGPTRCMEMSHGTAMSAMGGDDSTCICRCRKETPAFREDQRVCVNNIDECLMASFGRGAAKPQIPFVFLPLKGLIVYPAKEIIFTDVEDAICAVTSAQYLSPSGWMILRDVTDNDVPFSLYRDEGSTFLQWRGSAGLHSRLEGRMVAVHVLCSDAKTSHFVASCAAFRIAGASQNGLLDVRSIPYHAGEIVTSESSQNQGLSVLEALAIGVCVLLLIFVYAAGIIFYIHYKQRQRRKQKDPEQNLSGTLSSDNGSTLESRIDMSNVMLKTNPLLKLNGIGGDFFVNDNSMSDHIERSGDIHNSSPNNSQKFQKMNSSVISAMIHTRKKKPTTPSIRSVSNVDRFTERLHPRRSASPDTMEIAPHSDLSIVDCSVDSSLANNRHLTSDGEPALRRKLYFNPVFFETEHLKNPPPAAVEFLSKIREVMTISKDKITAKRFIPLLSDIPEEDLYHSIDLGWDIPCARRGRRFSAISLKQENSRRQVECGGCPGCDSNVRPQKIIALTRSNSCKSCVSEDYKQRIVRKWLDEVPTPQSVSTATKGGKSVPNVNGTPRITEMKLKAKVKDDIPKHEEGAKLENTKPKVTDGVLKEEVKDKYSKDNVRKDSKESKDLKQNQENNNIQLPKVKEETKFSKIKEELRLFKQKQDLKASKLVKEEFKKSSISKEDIKLPVKKETVKTKITEDRKSPKPVKEDIKLANISDDGKRHIKTTDDAKTPKVKEALKMAKSKEDLKLSKEELKANIKVIRSDENTPTEEKKIVISHPRPMSPIVSQEKFSPTSQTSHRIRKKLPPPPPPPVKPPAPPTLDDTNNQEEGEEPIPPEIKVRMEAVIRELNICHRAEPRELEEIKLETISPIAPKIVIPVIAADSHYFSDDNMLTDFKKKEFYVNRENFIDFDSLERNAMKKRRFSLACSPELQNKQEHDSSSKLFGFIREKLSSSSRDVTKSDDENYRLAPTTILESRRSSVSEVFVKTPESLYNNISEPGPLTIQVRGSPLENRRRFKDDFDPDTLDRRPKRDTKKRVEKILLKSAGSFKYKSTSAESENYKRSPEIISTKKIGNLRQIYEAKARALEEEAAAQYYSRRASIAYGSQDMSAFIRAVKHPDLIRHIDNHKGPMPPVPPKARRDNDLSSKFTCPTRESPPGDRRRMSEERDRFPIYTRVDNLNARRSGRRSARTRSRRTDLRKLYRTEDSGYMSTDSNESKRRASYLMQLRPKNIIPELFPVPAVRNVTKPPIIIQAESDTDELESLCDGKSESGGESVETDSVFFSTYEESKEIFAELGLSTFDPQCKMLHGHEQIDSGFMGETNIILSGDSDSEHRSVISIITGQDGRASSASISKLDESSFLHTIEC
ncbi:hypothetical protein K1T71_010301 [Dendrolimus kikuchii]|uniref:Uncharacterized protein n=1 Tax=Dendrolimus kikuchii TaxID=765133 RepID=A0ACC1CRV4_9NEOP|nr:hypothetical protein K1T71_010301 [Dendrolimus kikuchii]